MTPIKITPALHAYLTDWLAWVDRGAPDGEPYDRSHGLCDGSPTLVFCELEKIFGGPLKAPFGGWDDFSERSENRTMHLNEARLAWCRSTLATAEITE